MRGVKKNQANNDKQSGSQQEENKINQVQKTYP